MFLANAIGYPFIKFMKQVAFLRKLIIFKNWTLMLRFFHSTIWVNLKWNSNISIKMNNFILLI